MPIVDDNNHTFGNSLPVSLPCEVNVPESPGPISFSELKAHSVKLTHQEALPARTTELKLQYRKWTQNDTESWVVFSQLITPGTAYTISSIDAIIEYEFEFVGYNNIGYKEGPKARIVTRSETDSGEDVLPPALDNGACPVGRYQIKVTIPALPNKIEYYTLQVAPANNGPWKVALDGINNPGTVNVDKLDSTNTTLFQSDTSYYFRLIGRNATTGKDYFSGVVSINTLPEAPEKPTFPTFTLSQSPLRVGVLTPVFPARTVSYTLERSDDGVAWNKSWPGLLAGVTFPDTEVTADAIYYYRLTAVGLCGTNTGDSKLTDTFVTLPSSPEPIYIKEIGGTYIVLKLQAVLPTKASTIQLMRDEVVIKNPAVLDETYNDSTLSISTKYKYKVRALNRVGYTDGPAVYLDTKPGNSINFLSSPVATLKTNYRIEIVAPSVFPPGVTGITLQVKDSLDSGWKVFKNGVLTNELIEVEDTSSISLDLQLNHSYDFRWFVSNGYGTYTSGITTVLIAAPATPLLPTSTSTVNSTAHVMPNLPARATGFQLQKKVANNWVNEGGIVVSGATIIDDNLDILTGYVYKLLAICDYGQTSTSEFTVTTKSNGDGNVKPGKPVRPVRENRTNTTLVIDTPDTLPSLTDWLYPRWRAINDVTWIQSDTRIYPTSASFTITGLTTDTYYEVQWVAKNSAGEVEGESLITSTLIDPPAVPDAPILENED